MPPSLADSARGTVPTFATTADVLRQRALLHPDRVAVTFDGAVRTYADLDARSNQVAQGLAAVGVRPGDRVAILDRNRLEHLEVMFGAAKVGATYLPVNWRLAADEVAFVLANSGATVLFVGAELLPLLDRVTSRPTVVVLDAEYARWLAAQPASDPDVELAGSDIALQMYTSGTTGLPKGVLLSHNNLCWGAAHGSTWGMDESSVSLTCMPLFHMSGTSWAFVGLFHGGRIVLLR